MKHPQEDIIKKWVDDITQDLWIWYGNSSGWQLSSIGMVTNWGGRIYAIGDKPTSPPAFQEIEELNELYMAAKNVIAWTEATHRPPVCDAFETGQMVKVRLHALADLQDAIEAVREKNNVR